jgi:hypothetical protein
LHAKQTLHQEKELYSPAKILLEKKKKTLSVTHWSSASSRSVDRTYDRMAECDEMDFVNHKLDSIEGSIIISGLSQDGERRQKPNRKTTCSGAPCAGCGWHGLRSAIRCCFFFPIAGANLYTAVHGMESLRHTE